MSGNDPSFTGLRPNVTTGATVVLYGCSPPDEVLPVPNWPMDPIAPGGRCSIHGCTMPCAMCALINSMPSVPTVGSWALAPCPNCNNHVRVGEPCPFCLRADVDALMAVDEPVPFAPVDPAPSPTLSADDADALIVKLDSVETANIQLRDALRKAIVRLRKYEDAGGVPVPEIGELESVLGEAPR